MDTSSSSSSSLDQADEFEINRGEEGSVEVLEKAGSSSPRPGGALDKKNPLNVGEGESNEIGERGTPGTTPTNKNTRNSNSPAAIKRISAYLKKKKEKMERSVKKVGLSSKRQSINRLRKGSPLNRTNTAANLDLDAEPLPEVGTYGDVGNFVLGAAGKSLVNISFVTITPSCIFVKVLPSTT